MGNSESSSNFPKEGQGAAQPKRSREAILATHRAVSGDTMFAAGRTAGARQLYSHAAELDPANAQHQFKIAVCDWRLGNFDSVFQHLQEALRIDPRMAPAHEWLSQWYLQAGIVDAAEAHSAAASELAPRQKGIRASRAFVLEAAGDFDAAWQIAQQLLAEGYTPPRIVSLFARLSPRYGQQAEALSLVMRMLSGQVAAPAGAPNAARPGAGRAIADPNLHFTAAELLDRIGRYDHAFAHAAEANRLRPLKYDAATHEQAIGRIIAFFSAERMNSLARADYRSDLPVFIVGMPRSGTSLLEQILASHPSVVGAGELDFIHREVLGVLQMLAAKPEDFPECLARLTVDQLDGLAQVYIEPLKSLARGAEISRVIDKMPLNFLHLGFIAMLLPNARIIHSRRDPLDTCLSCYMSNFTAGHEFRSDLAHLGHYYRQYERLMSHWKRVLPLPMLEVQYEQVVINLEGQSRRMLEFLGLPWNDRCLRFHETRRAVTTASVAQVRQPIYGSSIQRWRKYEKHLEALKKALE